MQIKELIENLKKYPEDAEVILSSDEEGNQFGELWHLELAAWQPKQREIADGYYKNETTKAVSVLNPQTDRICVILYPDC